MIDDTTFTERPQAAQLDPPDDDRPDYTLLRKLRTGAWLDQQEFAPLAWVVPGLVPEGLTMLVGGPKVGKSWLGLDIALAVASGGKALGSVLVGPARPVLLLALEDGDRRLQDRARTLMAGTPIPGRLDYMTEVHPGMVADTIREWLDRLDPDTAPLVILDVLGKAMPPTRQGETNYERDYRMVSDLKALTRRRTGDDWPGLAVLVLHHDRKAQSDDFVDTVSGTNGIAGAADTVIVLARPRTEDRGLLKITGRDVVEREYAVTVQSGRWGLAGASLDAAAAAAGTVRATANLGDRSAEVVRFVNDHPQGVVAAQVAEAIPELSKKDASTYLARAFDAGRVERPSRGVYTPCRSVGSVGTAPAIALASYTSHTSTPEIRDACHGCGEPLHPVLVAAGETTHPTCGATS